jgi:Ca-activated chloride channel family protein
MKSLLSYLLILALSLTNTDPVKKIAKANALKREAEAAYENEDFKTAVDAYIQLIDSLGVVDPRAQLNLANAAYRISYGSDNFDVLSDISQGAKRIQDSASLNAVSEEIKYFDIADANYRALRESDDASASSMALNQLGVIAYRRNEISKDDKTTLMNQALGEFKSALIRNPQNEQARYNYELLKKIIRQQQEQEQENQDQDEKQDQQQDQKNQDQQQDQQQQQQDQQQEQEKKDQEQQQDQNQEQQDQEQSNKNKSNNKSRISLKKKIQWRS